MQEEDQRLETLRAKKHTEMSQFAAAREQKHIHEVKTNDADSFQCMYATQPGTGTQLAADIEAEDAGKQARIRAERDRISAERTITTMQHYPYEWTLPGGWLALSV